MYSECGLIRALVDGGSVRDRGRKEGIGCVKDRVELEGV